MIVFGIIGQPRKEVLVFEVKIRYKFRINNKYDLLHYILERLKVHLVRTLLVATFSPNYQRRDNFEVSIPVILRRSKHFLSNQGINRKKQRIYLHIHVYSISLS